jgi:hypothetical protein
LPDYIHKIIFSSSAATAQIQSLADPAAGPIGCRKAVLGDRQHLAETGYRLAPLGAGAGLPGACPRRSASWRRVELTVAARRCRLNSNRLAVARRLWRRDRKSTRHTPSALGGSEPLVPSRVSQRLIYISQQPI